MNNRARLSGDARSITSMYPNASVPISSQYNRLLGIFPFKLKNKSPIAIVDATIEIS